MEDETTELLRGLAEATTGLLDAIEENRQICRRVEEHDDGDTAEHDMGIIAPEGMRRIAVLLAAGDETPGVQIGQLTVDAQESEETWRAATRALLAEKKLTLLYDQPGRFELLGEDGRPHEP